MSLSQPRPRYAPPGIRPGSHCAALHRRRARPVLGTSLPPTMTTARLTFVAQAFHTPRALLSPRRPRFRYAPPATYDDRSPDRIHSGSHCAALRRRRAHPVLGTQLPSTMTTARLTLVAQDLLAPRAPLSPRQPRFRYASPATHDDRRLTSSTQAHIVLRAPPSPRPPCPW